MPRGPLGFPRPFGVGPFVKPRPRENVEALPDEEVIVFDADRFTPREVAQEAERLLAQESRSRGALTEVTLGEIDVRTVQRDGMPVVQVRRQQPQRETDAEWKDIPIEDRGEIIVMDLSNVNLRLQDTISEAIAGERVGLTLGRTEDTVTDPVRPSGGDEDEDEDE